MFKRALCLCISVTIGFFEVTAQNLTKSPYSSLGVGDIHFPGTAKQSALGQLGQGIRSSFEINSLNPASYGALKETVLEAGALYSVGTISSSTSVSEVDNFSFGYFKLAFPVSYKLGWGMGFGLEPYSNVGYDVSSSLKFPDYDATLKQVGSGGLSRFYGGTGIAFIKDKKDSFSFSGGVQASYIFGSNETKQTLIIPREFNRFNTEQQTRTIIGDFQFQYSLQYHQKLKNDITLVGGASMWQQARLNASQEYFAKSMGLGGLVGVVDTIAYVENSDITILLPSSYALGFGMEKKDKWFAGAEVSYQAWSDYRLNGQSDSLKNAIGINLGASYIPNISNFKNYFSRVEYRAGLRFDNGNVNANNTDIVNYAFSLGAGLPLGKSKNRLNVGLEYMVRGTHDNSLIKEEYFRFVLGISVSDKWFNRYKYD